VPQQRKPVYVVGCLGSWQRTAAVLFDSSIDKTPQLEKRNHFPMLTTQGGGLSLERLRQCVFDGKGIRYLTARERERLQGFPDDYTNIKEKASNGSRYKVLGNSMAVPVMKWIGERIQMVQNL
jgi:site-specific DNA-cytosine methylase